MQSVGIITSFKKGEGTLEWGEKTLRFNSKTRGVLRFSKSDLSLTDQKAEEEIDDPIRKGDRIIFSDFDDNRKSVYRWAPLPKDNTPTQVWKKKRKVSEGPAWKIILLFREGKFDDKHYCKQKQDGFWQEVKIAA